MAHHSAIVEDPESIERLLNRYNIVVQTWERHPIHTDKTTETNIKKTQNVPDKQEITIFQNSRIISWKLAGNWRVWFWERKNLSFFIDIDSSSRAHAPLATYFSHQIGRYRSIDASRYISNPYFKFRVWVRMWQEDENLAYLKEECAQPNW